MVKKSLAAIWTAMLVVAVLIPSVPAAASTKVSVFNFPGLTEGDQSCSDEVDNLKEIITDIGGYTIDLSITSLSGDLIGRLNASKFFFVPDMESAFTVASGTDFPSSAVTDFRTWLNNGGVLVMTGTSGAKDIDFLNKITDWGLSTASGLNGATRNSSNVAGTPFGESTLAVTLGIPSATDAINKGSAPSSADFKAMWGTDAQAPVAVMSYGSGRIIYLGFDYFNSGRAGAGGAVCGANSDNWVQKIVPAALRYATQLADAAEAARETPSQPYTPAPRIPTFDAFATGPVTATPGQNLVLTGSRLDCTTFVEINSQPTNFSYGNLPSGLSQLTIAVPSNLKPGSHSMRMDSCGGPITFENLLVVPKPPAVFEAVARNSIERMLIVVQVQSFAIMNRLDYNHVECIVNASAKHLQTAARQLLGNVCKMATTFVVASKGSTSELRNTHKPENIWVRVTLSSK